MQNEKLIDDKKNELLKRKIACENPKIVKTLTGDRVVSCGHCFSCFKRQSVILSSRINDEIQATNKELSFITLTLDDNYFLQSYCDYSDKVIKNFIDRFRIYLKRNSNFNFKYLYCCEFGGLGGRPHFHLLLIGLDVIMHAREIFKKELENRFKNSQIPYTVLNELFQKKFWKNGFVYLDSVRSSDKVVSYVTKYLTKQSLGLEQLPKGMTFSTFRSLNKLAKNDSDFTRIMNQFLNYGIKDFNKLYPYKEFFKFPYISFSKGLGFARVYKSLSLLDDALTKDKKVVIGHNSKGLPVKGLVPYAYRRKMAFIFDTEDIKYLDSIKENLGIDYNNIYDFFSSTEKDQLIDNMKSRHQTNIRLENMFNPVEQSFFSKKIQLYKDINENPSF